MPSGKYKRCNLFEDDGRPRRLLNGDRGCNQGSSCRFVHPDERDWDDLPPSQPPPSYLLDKSTRRGSDAHSPVPRRRRSSPGPSSRRSRSRSPSRRDSHHSEDKARAILREDRDRRHRDKRGFGEPISPTMTAYPIHPLLVSPKPPVTAVPLQPPPPLPIAPSFLSSATQPGPKKDHTSATKPELTEEQKREVWNERIKLISDSTQAHSDYVRLSAELETYRRLTQSSRYAHLAEDNKSQLQAHLADLETRSQTAKKLHDAAVTQLTETDSWPIGRRPELHGAEAGYKQLVLHIAELKDTVTDMNSALNEIVAKQNASVEAQRKAPPPPPIMDIDPRPLKRRRDSNDNGADIAPHSSHKRRDSSPTPSPAEELEHLHDKLVGLEDQLSEFENSMTQHDRDIEEEIDARMNEKINELRTTLPSTDAKLSAPEMDDLSQQHINFQELEKNAKTQGEEIGELAEAVASLVTQSSEHGSDMAILKQVNEQLSSESAMIEQRLKACTEQQEKHRKEMAALTAALAAHLARPPSPPPSPSVIPMKYILESAKAHILESVHTQVRPLVDQQRRKVEEMLRAQNAEVYDALSVKMSAVLRMVEAVSARVETAKKEGHLFE